jgi:hypothetical protein
MNTRHWWLPSLSAMIWVALFLGLTLTSARTVLISADSDPGWHRRLGEWMIQHRAIIREYDFLHTYRGPLVTKEWLSEVLFAVAGRLFGWNGFVLVAATLIATCFWLLHRQLLAEGCDVVTATGMVLVAMLACSMHWLARPLLFTHLLTLVFAWELRKYQHGRASARRLFLLLPPLMILWVNLHGMFMTGLVLIAMHTLGGAIDAWRQSASSARFGLLAALLLVCAAASLANPNGWQLHAHVFRFIRSRELSTLTTENMSPNFHTVGMHGFLLLLFLLATVLLVVRPKLDATDVLLTGGWGCFALLSARNVPIFTLVTTPLVAQWFMELVQPDVNSRWSRLYHAWVARMTALDRQAGAAIIPAVVCLLLIVTKPGIAGGTPALATDFPSNRYPTAAVDYLRVHPDAVRAEMFNYFLWGGYLDYVFPERKPFIDSRNDSYGTDLVHDFGIVDKPKPGWEAVFGKYNIGWTILPAQHPLNRILELNSHWSLVFSNQQALIFSRVS